MDWRENFDESLLHQEALAFLIEYELDDAAAGITKLVLSKGLHSLSAKQLNVFKIYVVDKWLLGICKCCTQNVEGHELIGLWMNDGYCVVYHPK